MSAVEARPNYAEIYVKIGKCNEKLRLFDEAIAMFKKALRRDKHHFDANYKLGLVYVRNN